MSNVPSNYTWAGVIVELFGLTKQAAHVVSLRFSMY